MILHMTKNQEIYPNQVENQKKNQESLRLRGLEDIANIRGLLQYCTVSQGLEIRNVAFRFWNFYETA